MDWYRDGGDVASRMPLLSAYLCYAEPANTYWHLPQLARLLHAAAWRPAGFCRTI
jgi:hypothetical protein